VDEAHYLPKRVQKRIVKVMEEGKLVRLGETAARQVDVRFIFSSTELLPIHGREKHLLAGDSNIRRIPIVPLRERRADIPTLFEHHLHNALAQKGVTVRAIRDLFSMYHYETLILDGFTEDNVKGIVDFTGEISGRIDSGADPADAIKDAFSKRYGTVYPFPSRPDSDVVKVQRDTMEIPLPLDIPLDRYLVIEDTYRRYDGNVSAMERDLREQGFKYSRQALAKILDSMNLPRMKKSRK
jgi:hypothetical protein